MGAIDKPRCVAMKSGEDHELCVLDLGFLGLSGPQALGRLLAMNPGVPILVGKARASDGASGVRRIVRHSYSMDAFRLAIHRLRRTGAALYLRLEF